MSVICFLSRTTFFERDSESLRLETRYDNDTAEFVPIMHRPNGGPQIERFTDTVTFRERLEVLETQLAADHCTQHGPGFLHDGWKLSDGCSFLGLCRVLRPFRLGHLFLDLRHAYCTNTVRDHGVGNRPGVDHDAAPATDLFQKESRSGEGIDTGYYRHKLEG